MNVSMSPYQLALIIEALSRFDARKLDARTRVALSLKPRGAKEKSNPQQEVDLMIDDLREMQRLGASSADLSPPAMLNRLQA